MNYSQQRRTEFWVGFAVSVVLGGIFSWIAVAKELPFLWWFAGPLFGVAALSAWKATRPNSVFEREEEKFDAFVRRNPFLSSLLVIGAIAGGLWSIGFALVRVFSFFAD